MNEIDFKSNKQKTRELLKARMKKAEKQEKRNDLMVKAVIVLSLIMFLVVYSKMTNDAIKDCINNGNTKQYCEEVLG